MSASREFVEIDPSLLPRLETLIENLIALADELSGDCDREDDTPAEDDDSGIADGDALDLEQDDAAIAGRFAENLARKQARPDLYTRVSFHRGVTRF